MSPLLLGDQNEAKKTLHSKPSLDKLHKGEIYALLSYTWLYFFYKREDLKDETGWFGKCTSG